MTAVRKISIENDLSHVPFTLEAAGFPEKPIVTHQCPSCNSVVVLTAQEGRDLAAWLIGECVDDANGNGVIDDPTYGQKPRQPWMPSGPGR